ncbi:MULTISPECIES: Cro/CI family transcriptional regulator [Cysteiniphilum]|uniref:Cro/CI family transcriptional regulator n=1 Tax=Cysteiniphilum TaxID=2056696 RepID=UPI00178279F8|nr:MULTISPECIES: Cro/CI family transcriptional regulator [Cysteiniphilum]
MKTKEVIEYYGSQIATAKALQIATSSITTWGEFPPLIKQFEIERITNGELKADYNGPQQRRSFAEAHKKLMQHKDKILKLYKLGVRGKMLLEKTGLNTKTHKQISTPELYTFLRKISHELPKD